MQIVSMLTKGDFMKMPLYLSLFKTFHAQRKKNRENMKSFQLAPGQPKVLRFIRDHPYCKLKEIALEYDLENATVSRILDNLEAKEMILRQTNPQNKRAYQLLLTEKGLEALKKWEQHCLDIEAISLQGFSAEEKEQFQSYLARMYHNLTEKDL